MVKRHIAVMDTVGGTVAMTGGFIRDIEFTNRRIWGKVVYNVSYDLDSKKYTCECPAFCYRGKCRHIREFSKIVESEINA